MPFGVSVGDVIACAGLVKDLVKSLEKGRGSSAVYQELITELYILERALILIKKLNLDEGSEAKPLVERAVTSCQGSISRFLQKNHKFAPHLRNGGSSSSWKDALKKMQWALFRSEDVATFRTEINSHIGSINALLSTCQMQVFSSVSSRTSLLLSIQQNDFSNKKGMIVKPSTSSVNVS